MLNSNSITFRDEQGIFPLIVFQRDSESFRCIGTSFFINGLGIFVTAKHVIVDHLDENNMVFVVQNLRNRQTVNRQVTNLCIHPNADIAVGIVGIARDPMTARAVEFEVAPNCRLSINKLEIGTELMGFGYPRTEKIINANLTTFNFKGMWSKGVVNDFHAHGFSCLSNRCYQTDMLIESGSSGGPVFIDGQVVGINSSSFEMMNEEIPISFITPMDYLLDLQLPIDGNLKSIKELIHAGAIISN